MGELGRKGEAKLSDHTEEQQQEESLEIRLEESFLLDHIETTLGPTYIVMKVAWLKKQWLRK